MSQDISNSKEKSMALAIVLSLLWTGAGHLYAGKENRGVILLIIYFVLCVLSVSTGGMFVVILFAILVVGRVRRQPGD